MRFYFQIFTHISTNCMIYVLCLLKIFIYLSKNYNMIKQDITGFLKQKTKNETNIKKFDSKNLDLILEQEKKIKNEYNSNKINKCNNKGISKRNNVFTNRIKDCDIKNDLTELIYKRIKQHLAKDKQFSRTFEDNDYITIKDVLNLLNIQDNKCKFCGEEVNLKPNHTLKSRDLDAFSIDRINNKKAHIKSNCVISCFFCNANRAIFKDNVKEEKLKLKMRTLANDFDSSDES